MKLITRDTDYAIKALCFMAEREEKLTSVSELVRKLKIPQPFLRKLLQILNKKKVLKSYKGQGGGFRLAVLPSKIFLVNLIEIFQGPFRLNECMFKKKICPAKNNCALRKKVNSWEKYLVTQLKAITITDLLR